MNGLMLTADQLVGRLTDEPEVKDTLAALGLVPDLVEELTKVQSLEQGVEASLHTPWVVKLPAYAGLEQKPKRRKKGAPYARAVVHSVDLFAPGVEVWVVGGPARQAPMAGFAGPLPRGVSWGDTPSSLIERFGPPRYRTDDETTGAPTWLRWNLPEESRYVMVDATPDGRLTAVRTGLFVPRT
jgi:hypothetical protein